MKKKLIYEIFVEVKRLLKNQQRTKNKKRKWKSQNTRSIPHKKMPENERKSFDDDLFCVLICEYSNHVSNA